MKGLHQRNDPRTYFHSDVMKCTYLKSTRGLPLVLAIGLVSACSNTTIVMHRNALDINAEFTADLASPVSFNAGYESRTSVAVPPKNSQPLTSLFNQFVLPEGDVLSTVSAVKVERPKVDVALGGVALDFVSVAATGEAASIVTGRKKSSESTAANGGTKPTSFGDTAAIIVEKP